MPWSPPFCLTVLYPHSEVKVTQSCLDSLQQWHAEIHIPPNKYSHQIMFSQGYIPELGLGNNQQERLYPLTT